MDKRRRVGHSANDATVANLLLQAGCADAGRNRQPGSLRTATAELISKAAMQLREDLVDLLRLDGKNDQAHARGFLSALQTLKEVEDDALGLRLDL